jgi:hypothetical protein
MLLRNRTRVAGSTDPHPVTAADDHDGHIDGLQIVPTPCHTDDVTALRTLVPEVLTEEIVVVVVDLRRPARDEGDVFCHRPTSWIRTTDSTAAA